ncbi:MAG: hypothetical protein ABII00_15395 [Elusimicrobiota bacterium]
MTPDELRAIMDYLRGRVRMKDRGADGLVTIVFDAPTADEMARAGLNAEGCAQVLGAPWFGEMAADIIETPEMCEKEDPPERVLEYAKDVVSEYIRKRAKL